MTIKKTTYTIWLTFLTLVAAFVLDAGCAVPKAPPNPLAGWKVYVHEPNETITQNYKDYIAKLPDEERKYAGMIQYFEDGSGKIAVKIEIPLHGSWWQHILIYDQNNNRINTIKYASGSYRS